MKENRESRELLPIVATIIDTIRTRPFSTLEKHRFGEDLLTLKQRLVSHEYLQTSFKPRNQLSIPERTEEFYKDLGFFFSVGKIWEKIFTDLNISKTRNILDIGPGYFPKVELGLYYAGYRGSITLLDQDTLAIKSAERFLKFFNCQFSLLSSNRAIEAAPRKRYDLIVANHFLDDFGLASHCQMRQIDIADAYNSEKLYRSLWSEIAENPSSALHNCKTLAHTLAQMLTPKGSIVLLDYTSFSHRALGLRCIATFVKSFRRHLLRELRLQQFKRRQLIQHSISCDRLNVSASNLMCVTKVGGPSSEKI